MLPLLIRWQTVDGWTPSILATSFTVITTCFITPILTLGGIRSKGIITDQSRISTISE
jgi:hypothetical protein